MNSSYPRDFWNEINELGQKNTRQHIDSVRMEDGSISYDQDATFKPWKEEYSKLFKSDMSYVDDTF